MESITPIPSEANFILFKSHNINGQDLYNALCEEGVLIRYFGGSFLEDWLRATIGTSEDNDLFLSALEKVAVKGMR